MKKFIELSQTEVNFIGGGDLMPTILAIAAVSIASKYWGQVVHVERNKELGRVLKWLRESPRNLNMFNFNSQRIKATMITGTFIALTYFGAELIAHGIHTYIGGRA